ncbi:hypothetical protein B296_00036448 [Ensete ventricosum]|uniref:Uncharacterized protein n=1 Tax=Ensete ventricosum TaxID=4639 RepID=A0A426Y3H8_ENSVE|nr:hypothetical protein B296_00036448 [Ensete ventricosum]
MKGATKAMGAMNKSEMMSDSIDDVLDNDEAEDEIEDLTSQVIITFSPFQEVYLNICNYFEKHQVLDEIGVDVASQVCTFSELERYPSAMVFPFFSCDFDVESSL